MAVDCSAAGCCGSVVVPLSVPSLCTSSLALRAVVFSTATGAGSDCSTTGRAEEGAETGADVGTGTGTVIGSSASESIFFASGGVVVIRSREVYAKGKQAG